MSTARRVGGGMGTPTKVTEVAIDGERWEPGELAAVVAAARRVLRSSRLDGELRDRRDPLRVTVDGPALWALGGAVDRPHDRREHLDPALHEAAD